MAAYLIADVEITDPAAYEGYRPLAGAAVEKYGGKFLARGGSATPAEGGWAPKRLVIVEFPSMEKLKAFYNSPEYAKARAIRQKASKSRLIFVEGVP
jgi:uncharacterized protein (DUF1330 family)